jgi:hypothetical protein
VFLVSGFESTVFRVGEGSLIFASGFLKEQRPIGEGGADFAGLMRTCVRVALLVGVAEVGAEPACKRVS